VKGPVPPRPYRIKPIFETVHTAPKRLLNLWAPEHHHKICIVAAFYIPWLLSFIGILHTSHSPQDLDDYGPPVRLSCVSRLWYEVLSETQRLSTDFSGLMQQNVVSTARIVARSTRLTLHSGVLLGASPSMFSALTQSALKRSTTEALS
jgi:hypothetical protein